jgi:hypothetical protein
MVRISLARLRLLTVSQTTNEPGYAADLGHAGTGTVVGVGV